MNYKIKWVTEKEYVELLKEWQGWGYDTSRGFQAFVTWDEHSSQPMLVRVAVHSLIKALL